MKCSRIRRPKTKQLGFGLLEALVALVLLSSLGFALLAWIQQNIDLTGKLRNHHLEQEARQTVIDWSSSVNFMETPKGEHKLGNLHISWDAELKYPITSQAGYPMGTGLFDLALYDISITASRADETRTWFSEKLVRVGYRKTRARRSFLNE